MASLEAVTVKSLNFYPFGILCEMFIVQRFILWGLHFVDTK